MISSTRKESLDEIVNLARQQIILEALIADLESALADHKATLRELSQEALPAAMAEVGLRKFVLDTGEEITIKQDFVVGIPAEARERAYDWLTRKGYASLIKTEVRALFGKGEISRAEQLVDKLSREKYVCEMSRSVNWQTLKAFINEQVRSGNAIPLDLFGAVPMNKAVISRKETV